MVTLSSERGEQFGTKRDRDWQRVRRRGGRMSTQAGRFRRHDPRARAPVRRGRHSEPSASGQLVAGRAPLELEARPGTLDVLDLDEIVSVQAAGYGGGSLVYANVNLRPPRSVFQHDWPQIFRDRTELDPYFDLVASMLEVAPVTAHPEFHAENHEIEAARAGRREARHAGLPPSAGDPLRKGRSESARRVSAALHRLRRLLHGLPTRGEEHTRPQLPGVGRAPRCRVLTQFEVLGLVERADGSWLVRGFDHLEARRVNLKAPYVFLCAGSVHSTELMARSQLLRKQSRQNGETREREPKKHVGFGYFPGGDALGMVYKTEHPQRPSVGPVISTSLVEWSDDGSFFMLQDGGYPRA